MQKNTSWWLILLLIFPTSLYAQDKGVHFERGLTWAQVQAKAKAENKYIFMDCFTSWCGPCKMMDTLVYPQQEVGDSINAKFISIRVQMNQTAADSPYVKLLYSDATEINKKYHITGYPTFLFFSPDGQIVHRIIGGIPIPKFFIENVAKALNPSTQYYTLLDQFNKNPNANPANISKLAGMAYASEDKVSLSKFVRAYLATQTDLYTKENVEFIYHYTSSSADSSFALFLNHADKIDSILGKGKSAAKILEIAEQEDYHDSDPMGLEPDWKVMASTLKKKYPGHEAEIVSWSRVLYYTSAKDWVKLAPAMDHYMKLYQSDIVLRFVDGVAQDVFDECPDKHCLETALNWSKIAKDQGNMTSNITYANLLYKTGNTTEAVKLMQEMLNRAGVGSNMFAGFIDKMNKGEKTWDTP